MERYTLDPEIFSLQRLFELTRTKNMIPSRLSLQEGLDDPYKALKNIGIENLQQLIRALGSRTKIGAVTTATGIPEEYLILLKREAGSYLKKPFPLTDFPGIPLEYTEVLKSRGIRNTREFFERVQGVEQRKDLLKITGIPDSRLREIYALCDLSRISGVGGIFARIIYRSGIRSLREFAMTDIATHTWKYKEILELTGHPVKNPGEDDLQYCISYANLVLELSPCSDST